MSSMRLVDHLLFSDFRLLGPGHSSRSQSSFASSLTLSRNTTTSNCNYNEDDAFHQQATRRRTSSFTPSTKAAKETSLQKVEDPDVSESADSLQAVAKKARKLIDVAHKTRENDAKNRSVRSAVEEAINSLSVLSGAAQKLVDDVQAHVIAMRAGEKPRNIQDLSTFETLVPQTASTK
ncbi:unnamed protein product [Amoebophrya sp. A25]|nr:unnamed protein product [Amoebophrya sp. A25]|eukprot:GSA25T00017223001.1